MKSREELRDDLNRFAAEVCAIPTEDGDAAWVLARIAQISDYYAQAGVILEGGTVRCGAVLGAKLEDLVLPVGWELTVETYLANESTYTLFIYPEDEWLSEALRAAIGLTAATPLSEEEVDIRWALQGTDRVSEPEAIAVAETLAAR